MDEEHLDQAIGLLRAGKAQAAQSTLIDFLRRNPSSERGWFFLSFAVPDTAKQVDCLERALKINPEYKEARARLARLTSGEETPIAPPAEEIPPQTPPATYPFAVPEEQPTQIPEEQPPEPASTDSTPPFQQAAPTPVSEPPTPLLILPSQTPQADTEKEDAKARARRAPRAKRGWSTVRWVALILTGLVLITVIGIAAMGFLGSPAPPVPTRQATLLPVAVVATATPQDLPPTWTSTPVPTTTSTPTSTPRPSMPTPDLEMAVQMDIVQQQVSALRGLTDPGNVGRFMIPQDRVRDKLEEIILEADQDIRAEVRDQVRILSALGLTHPTYDLYTKMLNNLGDGLGGFYVPSQNELYVIGEVFSNLERFILSHEYDHALVHQNFDIEAVSDYPDCPGDTQRCEAIKALIEGDATFLMYQWLQQHIPEDEYAELFEYELPTEIISSADFPPPYVEREVEFWYFDGANFVQYLFDRGEWDLVDLAYQELPLSTEHILHPEKYQSREPPVVVAPQPLGDILGDGWRLLTSDVLGELTTAMILGYGVDAIAQLDVLTATAAAAGWGGDNYQVYYKGSTNETVLAAHWIWDSQFDTDEFTQALGLHLNRLYAGNRFDHPEGLCWQRLNQKISCIFSQRLQVLWLEVPNANVLLLVKGLYPDFH